MTIELKSGIMKKIKDKAQAEGGFMKVYRVILLFANYHYRSVWVRSDSKLGAARQARDEWRATHTSQCTVWAVYGA